MKGLQNIYKKQVSIIPPPVLAYAAYTLPGRSHCMSHPLTEEAQHSQEGQG